MNSEDIKATHSMQDVLNRYGLIPNRAKFIQCPFHQGDREPSMKIYKDSFHCFGCGANGDIFDFVARMENTDFKGAYRLLGGTYDRDKGRSQIKASTLRKIQQSKKAKQRKIQKEKAGGSPGEKIGNDDNCFKDSVGKFRAFVRRLGFLLQ